MPGPRAASAFDRFALSKLALKMMPPGTRCASFARWSATFRFKSSDSRTHGPAMRNSLSSGKSGTSVSRLHQMLCGLSLTRAALELLSSGDESGEQWMRTRRTRLELGMELAPDEPRMLGELDDFYKLAVGRQSAESQPVLHEQIAISIRHFVAMPVPLAHLCYSINFGGA